MLIPEQPAKGEVREAFLAIGATMVGSITFSRKKGEYVTKGDENFPSLYSIRLKRKPLWAVAMASSSLLLSLFIIKPSFPTSRISVSIPPSLRSLSSHPIIRVSASIRSVHKAAETSPVKAAAAPPHLLPFRVGHGFDLHRLEPGLPLIIGGIDIPHDRGCEAHSDGDVLLHCVVDAILGALGLPDIGQIFPDNDPKWRGAKSSVFIREAVKLMHEAGYEMGNLDATLILQRPKISPHKEAIRDNLCNLLGADPSAVNIKAKTHEKVDSLGENRSIAAHTVVLLMKK